MPLVCSSAAIPRRLVIPARLISDTMPSKSVTVGTIFERTRVPLTKWLQALHILSTRKGVTLQQITDTLGVTYKTVLKMWVPWALPLKSDRQLATELVAPW